MLVERRAGPQVEKLKAAADSDAVLAIAQEAGFGISADDLKNAQVTELSDEELEGVAGGGACKDAAGCDSLVASMS